MVVEKYRCQKDCQDDRRGKVERSAITEVVAAVTVLGGRGFVHALVLDAAFFN